MCIYRDALAIAQSILWGVYRWACLPYRAIHLDAYGYSIGTLLYTYCISTDYLPYPYAAPSRAMQGVTSYKSLLSLY